MTRAKRQMQEDIRLIDLVIELLDARAPLSSRNPDIDEIAKGKSRLILLNKADLADRSATDKWYEYFVSEGFFVCRINAVNRADMKQIDAVVKQACAAKIERDRARGIKNRPVRAMVVGIPNVGKSTFINTYARKAAAKTGNKPGVTKGKQWIRMGGSLELLDTPGILWPKFEDQSVGLKLAMIGSIKDEIMNTEELALEAIRLLGERYPGAVEAAYGLSEADNAETGLSGDLNGSGQTSREDISEGSQPADVRKASLDEIPDETQQIYAGEEDRQDQAMLRTAISPEVVTLYGIAKARGCLKQKGELDTLKASNLLLENFRNGRIGKFTLELPEDFKR